MTLITLYFLFNDNNNFELYYNYKWFLKKFKIYSYANFLVCIKYLFIYYLFFPKFNEIIQVFMNTESFLVIIAPLLLFVFGVLLIPKIINPKKI